MPNNLIVVESPAKARTITRYLGKRFEALATYGHVRDLLPKSGAVVPDEGFRMNYEVIDRNRKHVDAIAKKLKQCDALYLATDPDREGEAISWHLLELLNQRGVLGEKQVFRVAFYEITKKAIQEAVENPSTLSTNLINAQQARRALDYLVGFNLSPLLWKKVHPGLSAGRVQSPALRLICEREHEIEKFEPREYWTIESDLEEKGDAFEAKLTHFEGNKLSQFDIGNEEYATRVREAIEEASGSNLTVSTIERKKRRRHPAPPFTTSTLQQEASRKLGFGASRTMRVAQQLYEGINVNGEQTGLISYMRTDSVNLANDAIEQIRAFIQVQYGAENVPEKIQRYKNRSKNAQEAHEAIRPTRVDQTPASLEGLLDSDQYRLYDLIWKRTMASQMVHAVFDQVAVQFAAGSQNDLFRATGSTLVVPGFIAVYQEGRDDASKPEKEGSALPALEEGQKVSLLAVRAEQHFTEPPPRYSEASLVKTLESYGIGRPSTYANIIRTLVDRDYVELESRRFTPTDIGRVVNHFLTKHFSQYVDYDFTAKLEDELDAVSRGEKEWTPVMETFWGPFDQLLREKESSVTREEAVQARELGTDPKSGKPVSVRMGRYGPFVQIGTREDEEKPKFAGLRPGQKMSQIDFDQAMELFKLPRELGAGDDGYQLRANIGRFGPYIQYGAKKYVSLKEEDPYTVSLESALQIVRAKIEEDRNRVIHHFEQEGIQVLNGRYGPYITDGSKNARIPKDINPAGLSLEECLELLAKAPERKRRGKKASKKKMATKKKTAKKKTTKKKTARKKTTKRKTKKKVTEKSQ
ncbi:MAG: DNA topoisomerase I [Acidiferrobacteraceae bacterium]|jgi:DNA topoisomerase-1|nr:DNA topoisomerase I [Acidiferrobacteraceae bacterium]MDP6434243.1 DNA topoisomerase I [Arenicellales bacterium]MDP6671828.1 DNA topoisomerase I [Arenicellales bacterium]MDP6723963.1 DNA topoisomerase I [Arenicellales bacterium]|tara:strand:+ start:22105 stop:24534 length:2430 start_codon:yes stop_codon:yes gene_type:complete